METIYDWITIALFAALIVLFLQRSSAAEPRDNLWEYLVASAGCAGINYLGNEGYDLVAVLGLAAWFAFVQWRLKPFGRH